MKEIHAPILAQIIPVVLGCLDAGRAQFGIASVPGATISPDQTEMHVLISCERDQEGACRFAKQCVREVVDVLKRSKLLRNIPYVSFKPAPQDQTARLNHLIAQAGQELARVQPAAAPAPVAVAAPAMALPVKKAVPAKKPAAHITVAKKAVAKKLAVKKIAKKAPAKKAAGKKIVVKKPAAKKAAPKKAPAKKIVKKVAKKAAPKKSAKKAPAKKKAAKSRR